MTEPAVSSLLQLPIPPDAREAWAALFAQPLDDGKVRDQAALVFRLGVEWLALPAALFVGAADPSPAHRLPHRHAPGLRGIVNVRGQLYPCIALGVLLGIADSEALPASGSARGFPRQLLVTLGPQTYAFSVEEVLGLQRYAGGDLQAAPSTVAGQLQPFLSAVLAIDGRQVGLLATDRLERVMRETLL